MTKIMSAMFSTRRLEVIQGGGETVKGELFHSLVHTRQKHRLDKSLNILRSVISIYLSNSVLMF